MVEKVSFWNTYLGILDIIPFFLERTHEFQPDIPLDFLVNQMKNDDNFQNSLGEDKVKGIKDYISQYLEQHQIKDQIAEQYQRVDSIGLRIVQRLKANDAYFEHMGIDKGLNPIAVSAASLTHLSTLFLIPFAFYEYDKGVLRKKDRDQVLDEHLNIISQELSRYF